MNTHLQLLWQSVFAPRAAIDLAKEHPNPFQLGLSYLGALCLIGFVVLIFVPALVQPLHPADPTTSSMWIDTPIGAGLVNAVLYTAMFFASRWYWLKMLPPDTSKHAIDAAVALTFASSLMLLLPQEVLIRLFENADVVAMTGVLSFFAAIVLGFGTIYFSHAAPISIAKSFWLNVFLLIIFLLLAVIILLPIIVMSPEFNTELGTIS